MTSTRVLTNFGEYSFSQYIILEFDFYYEENS